MIELIDKSLDYAESYNMAVTSVCKEGKYLSSSEGFPLESSIGFVKFNIEANNTQLFAIKKKIVVGWCDITPKGSDYFKHVGVMGMGVISEYRGQGIGYRLLVKALEEAKNRGLEKVELEVFASNHRAISLYENLGFSREGIRVKGKKVNGIYEDIILMGKLL